MNRDRVVRFLWFVYIAVMCGMVVSFTASIKLNVLAHEARMEEQARAYLGSIGYDVQEDSTR